MEKASVPTFGRSAPVKQRKSAPSSAVTLAAFSSTDVCLYAMSHPVVILLIIGGFGGVIFRCRFKTCMEYTDNVNI